MFPARSTASAALGELLRGEGTGNGGKRREITTGRGVVQLQNELMHSSDSVQFFPRWQKKRNYETVILFTASDLRLDAVRYNNSPSSRRIRDEIIIS